MLVVHHLNCFQNIWVLGKDNLGIIYNVTKIVSEHQVNILDISQTIMSDDIFAMFMLVDVATFFLAYCKRKYYSFLIASKAESRVARKAG